MDDASIDQVIASFTSLDHSETFVQNLLITTEAQERIHAKTSDIRTALITAFVFSEDAGLRKRAERIADCCKWPLLILRNNGLPAMSLQRCRDRLCPVCSRIKGLQTTARVQEAVKLLPSKRFMTLTIKSTEKTLKQASRDATNGFRELRRSKIWKQHVTAGIWTKEIKPGTEEGTWNVHIHMIVSGKYFPQDQLSKAWLTATGDSFVVDIRKVNDDEKAASYVTKYISKPGNFNRWSQEEIVQFATAVKGDRMIGTFGKLHCAVKLDEEIPDAEKLSDRTISAHKLMQLASTEFQPAQTAVELLAKCGGFYSACVSRPAPPRDQKISESDLASLGAELLKCIEHLALLEQTPVCEKASADPTELEEETYQQLDLLDTSVGFAYR